MNQRSFRREEWKYLTEQTQDREHGWEQLWLPPWEQASEPGWAPEWKQKLEPEWDLIPERESKREQKWDSDCLLDQKRGPE